MNPSLMDSPVTLVIKAPSQKYDDQTIDCFLDWTVEKLKHHLSKVYPSKPSLKDQRLVYSGKLLLDHLQLKDVLRKQDDYHMVHLVCSTFTPPNSPKPNTRQEGTGSSGANSNSNLEHTSSTATSSASAYPHPTAPDLRQRNVPPAQSSPSPSPAESPTVLYFTQWYVNNQIPPQRMPDSHPQYPLIGPFHMLWWQQMYARQYYMQYHAAAISAQASASDEQTLPATPTPLHSEHVVQNQRAAAPNLAPQENRAVNQNVQMNAQGGPVMNEEDFNRDWLDWMYTFTRATILFSIVYFYSSFSRFVMMMGAMLLVYLPPTFVPWDLVLAVLPMLSIDMHLLFWTTIFLVAITSARRVRELQALSADEQYTKIEHQARWFPFRQEGEQQPAANPDANVNNDLQNVNHAELREMERLMDNGIDDESGEDAAEDIHTEQQPGILASAWTFITAFFISLIPEGPPAAPN